MASRSDLAARYTHAEELFRLGRMAEARELFTKVRDEAGAYRETDSYLRRIARQEDASKSDAKGGKGLSSPASGGLSSAEKVSRLLLEGRRSFQDGDLSSAQSKFAEALAIDSGNPEARKFMGEIESAQGSASLSPSVDKARLGSALGLKKAAPAPAPSAKSGAGRVVTMDAPEVANTAVRTGVAFDAKDAKPAEKSIASVQQFFGATPVPAVKPATSPVAAKPDSKPVEAKNAESKPAVAKAPDAKPAENKMVEAKPKAEAKPNPEEKQKAVKTVVASPAKPAKTEAKTEAKPKTEKKSDISALLPGLNEKKEKKSIGQVAAVASPVAAAKSAVTDSKPASEPKVSAEKVTKPASTSKKSEAKEKETAKEAAKVSADPQVEADKMLRQAQQDLAAGRTDDARQAARKALDLDPDNVEVKALLSDIAGSKVSRQIAAATPAPLSAAMQPKKTIAATPKPVPAPSAAPEKSKTFVPPAEPRTTVEAPPPAPKGNRGARQAAGPGRADEAEAAFQKGLVAYEAGRLDVAVQWWNHALSLEPNHPRAAGYLAQTKPEYDAWVQQHQYNAVQMQKESVASEKLDTPVTYDTAGQKSIVEFLNALSLISDVSFYLSAGVDPDVRITAKFEETPLHDTLDIVLLPLGLKWSRANDVISITPDLRTKFFNLAPDQVIRLKALLENKTLQTYLYGPEAAPPMKSVELALDDRNNTLLVTDSQENINKVEAFLKDLQQASPPGLVYKSWKIRPEEGQKIKAIVEGLVKVASDAPYDLQRKVLVDGNDLIVHDTAENITKVEQLLLDKNFIRKLETQKLAVATFNLTPREPINENIEQVRDYAANIVTVVKTILYAQSTESAASAEGRRYWYDPNTLQLTIVDYPESLREVSNYIRSLPQISRKQKSEIIFLKHQTASDMADLINRVLGLSQQETAGGGDGGQSVTKTLRPEGELTFRDLRIRVTKINENDQNDDNDDSVEMVVRTATTSEDRTIEEYRSEFIDAYEVNVLEVRPTGGNTGEGSARIEIRYNPNATGVTGGGGFGGGVGAGGAITPAGAPGAVPGQPLLPGQVLGATPTPATEGTVQIETIENLNALLIRYDDPGDLAEIKSYIDTLDIPVLQVNIETKLVEVNESRAKEWMPEFDLANITKGPDLSGGTLDGRFGRYADEFRDPFDPFPENLGNASLLKGTTVLNFTSLGESPVNFTLRTLEAEGVLNVVNGPHIVCENGETADFTIERSFGNVAAIANNNQNNNNGNNNNISNGQTLTQVDFSVTPQITQLGEIRLDIQNLELQDFGNEGGGIATIDVNGNGGLDNFEPTAIARSLNFEVKRRTITTVARCNDGGTVVLGGWTGEHSRESESGIPILRQIPYLGKLLFNRTSDRIEKTNLLIFLTCNIIKP